MTDRAPELSAEELDTAHDWARRMVEQDWRDPTAVRIIARAFMQSEATIERLQGEHPHAYHHDVMMVARAEHERDAALAQLSSLTEERDALRRNQDEAVAHRGGTMSADTVDDDLLRRLGEACRDARYEMRNAPMSLLANLLDEAFNRLAECESRRTPGDERP